MDVWAYQYRVHLDFIRPGKPMENSYIEIFNGRLRDECLNLEVFFALADVRDKLERWRQDYNQVRPHNSPHQRYSRRNAERPRRPLWKQFGAPAESPQRAIHRDTQLSLLRAKNAGISGLNRTTQAEPSTSTWYAFAGQVN
jgi:putative transposase